MLEYLIGAANVVSLAGCVYIAYLFFAAARSSRSGVRQNRAKITRDSASGEQYAASPQPDYYYVM